MRHAPPGADGRRIWPGQTVGERRHWLDAHLRWALEQRDRGNVQGDQQSSSVAPVKPSAFGNRLRAALGGVVAPVDYSGRTAYRRPPALYRHLQWLGWFLASHGWVPDFVVMLEVRGRRSGKVRRTVLVRTVHGGGEYLVALAGESEWVRNVRAAAGRAVIRHGKPRKVTLVEMPADKRPPIIREYLCGTGRRADSREAERYFGLSAGPSLEEIRAIVERYPVFEIVDAGPGAGRTG